MFPAIHSDQEEAAFLNDLLFELDDSFFNAVPSPDPTPVKLGPSRLRSPLRSFTTPTKPKRTIKSSPCRSNVLQLPSVQEPDLAALVEGAEDWDWGEMEADFLTPKKERDGKLISDLPTSKYVRETCTRCIVISVSEVQVNSRYQKNLVVQLDPGKERRSVILLDDWAATDIRAGDIVNVLGSFTTVSPSTSLLTSSIAITSKHNLLILHPDILITATALSNAPQCRRKPLLSGLIHSSSDFTPSLVWGNVLHEVMQVCLQSGNWNTEYVNKHIDEAVQKSLADLVKINIGVEQAKMEVKMRAKGLQAFFHKYLADTPKREAILTNTRSTNNQQSLLAISHLHDVEEDIWSPTYGIKGKLDATVQAVISDPNPPFKPALTSRPAPLEIKTGRAIASMEHRAQTMLYTLLATERYGVEVTTGLLYYTQNEEVVRVPASRNELRGLIGARNEMAGYMMRRDRLKGGREYESEESDSHISETPVIEENFLPATIDDERACKRCYALDACMLYRKAVENVEDTTSSIADIYAMKTSHLTSEQQSFFKKWEALLSFEERDLFRFRKELWTMKATERETKGRCFSSMILDTSYRTAPLKPGSNGRIHQFTYKFIRASGNRDISSLLNGYMSCGDAVTISVEPDLLALARGFIVELMPHEVIIGVDHEIQVETISLRASTLRKSSKTPNPQESSQIIFRIDKDELLGGMGRIRDNLARLFYADGDVRRLELIVDLKPPIFFDVEPEMDPSLTRYVQDLNPNQRQALTKVLSAQDYALILGMPGTGKTTVIAAIIRTLVASGKTILLTSYTHSAVDTILLKLKDEADFSILRLGNVDKVHPDVHKFTLAARKSATTVEQLEQQVMTPPVVATTCLSIDHALFTRRTFDYCIVDEASQITLPTCLGPLRFANKFVLVGDHFQLPPLVRNRDARKGGLDVSLFRRLSDSHPHAVIDMAYQYRMNEDIMLLSNKLIYGDRLRCGSDAVANRTLRLPNPEYLLSMHQSQTACLRDGCWIDRLMSESCKAVFVDTDQVPARDSRVGDLVQNEVEASLVYQITETLLRCGAQQDQIGIISLYRQQVKLLSHLLQDRKGVEIFTADRSQGRDKDCIIISMVRSNDTGSVGDLVKDWRRMNVSFTRARSKLIIFGSRKTLQAAPLLSEFFSLMENQGWILRLQPDAHKRHDIHGKTFIKPSKRNAENMEQVAVHLETKSGGHSLLHPTKKLKKSRAEDGILKGRPILMDLVNEAR